MKKPKNFDKIHEIKFSDIGVRQNSPYVLTPEQTAVDISHIVIYNASPKTTTLKTDVYHKTSIIVLVNNKIISGDELVMKIYWESQQILYYTQVQDTYFGSGRGFTSGNPLGSKNFFVNQARTLQGFIQMVILPTAIQAIERGEWSIDKSIIQTK
jgi:hypothetical protein